MPLKRLFRLTGWTIYVLEKIYGTGTLDLKLLQLKTLAEGTVGREIADMLTSKGYRLIPRFENHDLKHIVLDYEMTMKDEIRMQAYLIGNGNLTLPCVVFFSLAIFYPSIWQYLAQDYKNGKATTSIHSLTLDACFSKPLSEIRNIYGRKQFDR